MEKTKTKVISVRSNGWWVTLILNQVSELTPLPNGLSIRMSSGHTYIVSLRDGDRVLKHFTKV